MTKFIAFVSGKGGVGKTTTTLNVGQALANLGRRVILLDGNLVTPNLALHLGFMNPSGTVNKFLRKEKGLKEIVYLHECGISLIPASPSYNEFQKTNVQKLDKIFEHLNNTTDFVLIDSPSGLGYDVNQILKHCDEAVIVVTPTLSSVMDALKTIKVARAHNNLVGGVLLNMSNKGKHELTKKEVEDILGHPILAEVRHDKKFRKSLHKKMPLNHIYPHSRSAKEFKKMAEHLSLEN